MTIDVCVSLALIYLGCSLAYSGDEGVTLTHSFNNSGNNWVGQPFWIKCKAGSSAPDQNMSIQLTWRYTTTSDEETGTEDEEWKTVGCLRIGNSILDIIGHEEDNSWMNWTSCAAGGADRLEDLNHTIIVTGNIAPVIGSVVSHFTCQADYYNYSYVDGDERRRVVVKSDDVLGSPPIWQLPSNFEINVSSTVTNHLGTLVEGDLISITCTSQGGFPQSAIFKYDIYRGDEEVTSLEGFSTYYTLGEADRIGVTVSCTDLSHIDYPDQAKIMRNFSFIPHHFGLMDSSVDQSRSLRTPRELKVTFDCSDVITLHPVDDYMISWSRNNEHITEEDYDTLEARSSVMLEVAYKKGEDNTKITCAIQYSGDIDTLKQKNVVEHQWTVDWLAPGDLAFSVDTAADRSREAEETEKGTKKGAIIIGTVVGVLIVAGVVGALIAWKMKWGRPTPDQTPADKKSAAPVPEAPEHTSVAEEYVEAEEPKEMEPRDAEPRELEPDETVPEEAEPDQEAAPAEIVNVQEEETSVPQAPEIEIPASEPSQEPAVPQALTVPGSGMLIAPGKMVKPTQSMVTTMSEKSESSSMYPLSAFKSAKSSIMKGTEGKDTNEDSQSAETLPGGPTV